MAMKEININLIPFKETVWKGDLWSKVLFKVENAGNLTKGHPNFGKMHCVSAHLEISREGIIKEGKESHRSSSSDCCSEFISCTRMDFTDMPIIEFEYKNAFCANQLSVEKMKKISDFFKNDNNDRILLSQIHQEIYDNMTSSFALRIAIEYRQSLLENELFIKAEDNLEMNDSNYAHNFLFSKEPTSSTNYADSDFLQMRKESDENQAVTVFNGRSENIRSIEYKLCIQEQFANSEYINRYGHSEIFEWYCKSGGENMGIGVAIHLKNSRGAIVDDFDTPLPVKVQLVYDNGTLAPSLPVTSTKKEKSTTLPYPTLFRSLQPEPILRTGIGSQFFSFRIEEVSFHHPGHRGFTIKASPADDSISNVLPGIMNEILVVKSKPKHIERRRSKGGRTTPVQKAATMTMMKREEALKSVQKPRKVSFQSNDIAVSLQERRGTFEVNNETVSYLFTGGQSKCIKCDADLSSCSGLCPSDHEQTCPLRKTMLPQLFELLKKKTQKSKKIRVIDAFDSTSVVSDEISQSSQTNLYAV